MVRSTQLFAYPLLRTCLKLSFGVTVEVAEPELEPPLLIASNHVSRLDPFLLTLLPFRVFNRIAPIHFLTTRSYYDAWYIRLFIKPLGAFPVRRWAGSLEGLMGNAMERLRSGECVMIFPEGGILEPGKQGEARRGFEHVIRSTDIPVLPMRVTGFCEPLSESLGSDISVHVGAPFTAEEPGAVMERIYSLGEV